MDWLERIFKDSEENKNKLIIPSWVETFSNTYKLITSRECLIESINSLEYDEKKGITVVIFKDGTVIKKKTVEGDNFDLNVGVALCLADYLFESSNQYHKKVKALKTACDTKHKKKNDKIKLKKKLNKSKEK